MASSPRIEELRKKFEENPRRYFAPLANEYRKAGDVEQAIAICREYLPQQPGHMSGHIVFGQALYEARAFEEARSVFETALSLDPENLIALRHLGDISLITGDNESARTWYKRVLEADPRNEEIQAQLATIDQAAASAPTPAITPAIPAAAPTPVVVPATPATPSSSSPTVVMKAVHPPTRPAAPVTATSPTAEVNLDAILPPPPQAATPAPEPAPAPMEDVGHAPIEGLEGTAAAGADAPASSFSLDGLETTSLTTDAPPPPAPLADLDFGPAGASPPPPPPPPLADLDFGPAGAPPAPPSLVTEAASLPDLDFAPPPAAPSFVAPTVEVPAVDLDAAPTLDLDLGSLSTASAPPAPPAPPAPAPPTTPAPAAAPESSVPADEAPLDLEISLPSAPSPVAAAAEPAPPAPPLEELAMAAPPAPTAAPNVQEPDVAEPEAPGPVSSSSPFMTETMAELYVQQGHREEALRVYGALLEQRPGDASLQARIAALQAELAGPTDATQSSGPAMRELLAAIAARRPGYRPDWPTGNGTPLTAEPAAQAPAMPEPQPQAATPAPERAMPPQHLESRPDVLGPALSFAAPAEADEAAAHVLARAFRQNGHVDGAPLIAGEPARPAGDELSLKTVFKSDEPAPAPSSFSFDQFFSQRASVDQSAHSAPQGQAAESPEEVARFTQWLEGLKKR